MAFVSEINRFTLVTEVNLYAVNMLGKALIAFLFAITPIIHTTPTAVTRDFGAMATGARARGARGTKAATAGSGLRAYSQYCYRAWWTIRATTFSWTGASGTASSGTASSGTASSRNASSRNAGSKRNKRAALRKCDRRTR